ncbi:MAG: hypothetical protein WDN26_05760 [Chitinophagaceae bacterium]
MEQGWDPEVKKFFLRILNTISMGLIWLITAVAAGIYNKLAWKGDRPIIFVILFYTVAAISLFFVIRYIYRLWKK